MKAYGESGPLIDVNVIIVSLCTYQEFGRYLREREPTLSFTMQRNNSDLG